MSKVCTIVLFMAECFTMVASTVMVFPIVLPTMVWSNIINLPLRFRNNIVSSRYSKCEPFHADKKPHGCRMISIKAHIGNSPVPHQPPLGTSNSDTIVEPLKEPWTSMTLLMTCNSPLGIRNVLRSSSTANLSPRHCDSCPVANCWMLCQLYCPLVLSKDSNGLGRDCIVG